ncbi:MAG TPA: methylated-DNA--[protein]-cysteine S-methyltransferase [Steroidobacteraceae bacterium]|nr:methylated-DNA--[protein]-cysteine S-methyltransferase [Steroidobacteraceae bacterium]
MAASVHFTVFDTGIGPCALAWSEAGVVAVQLPESAAAETGKRLQHRVPHARPASDTPAEVTGAITAIQSLLSGAATDLSGIRLDMSAVPDFHRRAYDVARRIPPGSTLSYGELAERIGQPGAARAVGQAMGRNPFPIIVPCHRVLAAGGRPGGFSAPGGLDTKRRMLEIEGYVLPGRRAAAGRAQSGPAAHRFDFHPPAALRHLRAVDAKLAALIERVGPFALELRPRSELFPVLARSIVYQQLHGKAAATIFARLSALFPDAPEGFGPHHILSAKDGPLRGAGLSRNKLRALRDLAEKTASGLLPTLEECRNLDNETLIERITQVRGIGRWTVEMLLMFGLGRGDVLPVDDFGVRKGFAVAFGKRAMPTPKQLRDYGTRWAPYRSVASWYLWRAADGAPPMRGKSKAKAKAKAKARTSPRRVTSSRARPARRAPARRPKR